LLILSAYFFVLNAVKGLLGLLASGELPVDHLIFVTVFVTGMIVGILSFSRLLSYLFDRHPGPTLAFLVGLMVGCLRGIWPFRDQVDGVPVNAWPAEFDASVGSAIAAFAVGAAIVAALSFLGSRTEGHEAIETGTS
jgi:putative membrane protein